MRAPHVHFSAGGALKPSFELEFTLDALGEVVDEIDRARRTPGAWSAFLPEVDPNNLPPPRSAWYGLITARGPDIPDITWAGDEIGITHGTGPAAAERLASAGFPLRAGWDVWQDHPKRGLSLSIAGESDVDATLRWLLGAAEALSKVAFEGHWLARFYGLDP